MKDIDSLFNSSKLFKSPLFEAWENEMRQIDKIIAREKTLDRISILEQTAKVLAKRLDETQSMLSLFSRFLLQDPQRKQEWEKYRDENKKTKQEGK